MIDIDILHSDRDRNYGPLWMIESCMTSYTKAVGIVVVVMAHSMYWVMQDFYHQQFYSGLTRIPNLGPILGVPRHSKRKAAWQAQSSYMMSILGCGVPHRSCRQDLRLVGPKDIESPIWLN